MKIRTFAWLTGVVACAACAPSTQITFDIRTDVPCADIQSVGIAVGPTGFVEEKAPVVVTSECTEGGNLRAIGTYAVVPQGNPVDVSVRVTLAGKGVNLETDCTAQAGYRGCIVGRRALTFIPKRNLIVPIDLLLVCRGVACDEFTTCSRAGRCVSGRVDINRCEGDTCAVTVVRPEDGLPVAVETFSSLTIAPESVAADGVSAATVSLKLNDALGAPVVNAPVAFAASGRNNLWSAASSTTDGTGTFTAELASSTAERKTVVVTASGLSLSAAVTFVATDGGAIKPGLDGGADAGLPPGYGDSCVLPSDCLGVLRCLPSGRCGYQCAAARDCTLTGQGDCCVDNLCLRGLACTAQAFDAGPNDGGALQRECTTDDTCVRKDGFFCNGAERCENFRCVKAPRAPCDDGNPCTQDFCDEVQDLCGPSVLIAPSDVDGDGHFALACGGSADDCDDTRADVYPGAVERCDAVDNNCNGAVDENTWSVAAPTTVWPQPYFAAPGPPSWVRDGASVRLVVSGDRLSGNIDGYTLDSTTLAYQAGPTPVLRSRTPWALCTTISGQRWAAPQLAASPSGLLTTAVGLSQNDDGSGCCTALNPWSLESLTAVSGTDFQGVDAGTLYAAPAGAICAPNVVPSIGKTSLVFPLYVPQRAAWQIFFQDEHEVSIPGIFYTARVQADGRLSGLKRLLDVPAITAAGAGGSNNPRIGATVTPGGIFVAWSQQGQSGSIPFGLPHVRYALFDFDLTAPLWGPFALGGTMTDRNFYSLAVVGQSAVLLTAQEATGAYPLSLQSVSLVDGALQGPAQLLPPALVTQGLSTDLLKADPGLAPAMAPVNGGVAIAHVRVAQPGVASQSSLSFLWLLAGADAGTPAQVSLTLPGIPSAVSLLPLTSKQVAAVWVAGQLDGGPGPITRAVFECGP